MELNIPEELCKKSDLQKELDLLFVTPSGDRFKFATSSYNKVYHRLGSLEQTKKVWNEAVERLKNIRIQSWHVEATGNVSTLYLSFDEKKDAVISTRVGPYSYPFDSSTLINSSELEDIAFRYHHMVGTFNTSIATVMGRSAYARRVNKDYSKVNTKDGQEDFPGFITRLFLERFNGLRDHVISEIKSEVEWIQTTDVFKEKEKEAFVRTCMNDVKSTLNRYKFLGDDTLREAIRRFEVEDVMEN